MSTLHETPTGDMGSFDWALLVDRLFGYLRIK